MYKNVCVFCGSSSGEDPFFLDQARVLGTALAKAACRLVYGGGNLGLMGAVSESAIEGGAEVIGIIPERLNDLVDHGRLTELIVCKTMHERKAKMYERSEAFIVLPGGIGTLDELFESWTWLQLGYHRKPIAVLNSASYYDGLKDFLHTMVKNGFLRESHYSSLIWAQSIPELFEKLESWTYTAEPKLHERS